MRRCCLLAIMFLLFTMQAIAQNYSYDSYFRHFPSVEGLQSSAITCCIQDHNGFIWLGTKDGLGRFDGYSFNGLQIPDSESQSGMTMCICEDADHLLWFSTTKGTGWYDLDENLAGTVPELSRMMFFDIDADKDGNIWFSSPSEGIFRYEKASGEVVHCTGVDAFKASRACVDSDGKIWFAGEDGFLHVYNPRGNRFDTIQIQDRRELEKGSVLSQIICLSDGKLVIASSNTKLYMYDSVSGKTELFFDGKKFEGISDISGMVSNSDSEVWIATNSGLYVWRRNEEILCFKHDTRDQHSLSNDNIACISEDGNGDIWVGTFYAGVNFLRRKSSGYSLFFVNSSSNSLGGSVVHSICGDGNGYVWVGTEDGGISRYDTVTGRIQASIGDLMGNMNVQHILSGEEGMWVSTYTDGLYLLDRVSTRVLAHYSSKVNGGSTGFKSDNSLVVCPLSDGDMLVGTLNGIYQMNKANGNFSFVDAIGIPPIYSIVEDHEGNVWAGSFGSGLWFWDRKRNVFHQYLDTNVEDGLSSNYVIDLHEDSKGRIWATTDGGGLCLADRTDGESISFSSFGKSEGFPTNVVNSIVEDSAGILWVGTSNGIVEFDPVAMKVNKVHMMELGTIGNYFMRGTSYSSPEGVIYMGTSNGMVSFNPDRLTEITGKSNVYITGIEFRSYSGIINEKQTSSILAASSKSIRIPHRDAAVVSISLSSPSYRNQNSVTYEYEIKKENGKSYKVETKDHVVTLTDLNPGKYLFMAAVQGDEDSEDSASLELRIAPPFHKSLPAYLCYMFLLAGLAFVTFQFYRRRKHRELEHQMQMMEMGKRQEISNAKINFFTNIAHEVRTPLTLIKLPLEKILDRKNYTEGQEEDLFTIRDNVNRLMELINKLLDMRKMEKGEMALNFMNEDLGSLLGQVVSQYEQISREQGVRVETSYPQSKVYAMCARDSIAHILSNLLTNAIKYGHDEIRISLSLSEDSKTAVIRVDSNGTRIPEKNSEDIFEAFYQLPDVENRIKESSGTGLGLPFARSLAQMHNGRLYLDTKEKDWNSFVLELPVTQQEMTVVADDATETADDNKSLVNTDPDQYKMTILIVEDEPSMRQYLAKELSEEYNILQAANGKEALDVIREYRTDLIISDIMMPVMDGCELCNTVKNDVEFSHIPILLLTAATGLETRIKTLESGANGYIEKPFKIELLMSSVRNLFNSRDLVFKQFTDSPLTHLKSISLNKVESVFMSKVHAYILENISDSEFNIDALCAEMNTSKSTLYRKIKADTGMNPNEYIRLCRLKKAAEMLSNSDYRVNEVAYLVGFSSLSYFTAIFKKQFNISPSAFVKEQRGKNS